MKSSFIFEIDELVLDVFYTYEKGMDGDGWLVPDDPDELYYDEIYLIAKSDDVGTIINIENTYDVKNILSYEILDKINDAMQEDLEEKDYFR